MLELTTELLELQDQTNQLNTALTHLLESDVELDRLNLTQRYLQKRQRQEKRSLYGDDQADEEAIEIDHSEVEMILEHYRKHVADLLSSIKRLENKVTICEKMTAINLNCARNRIMQTELKVGIAYVSLSSSLFLTFIFCWKIGHCRWRH